MKKYLIALILMASLLINSVAIASDISAANYLSTVSLTNNGSAKTDSIATWTLSTADMISNGMLNATADDAALITGTGGSDIPFMPSVNSSYPWVSWVSAIGGDADLNQYLYTGGASGGAIRYFPGFTGMNVPDDASIEITDNGSIIISGYFDSTVSGNIFDKPGAIRGSGDGSGNVTVILYEDNTINQTSQDTVINLYNGASTRAGQRIDNFPVSVITSVTMYLYKQASPTGTANVTVTNADTGAVLGYLGTIDVSTLAGSLTFYTFTNPVDISSVQDIRITIDYNGGDATDKITVGFNAADTVDGVRTVYSGSWSDTAAHDLTFNLTYGTPGVTVTASGVTSGEHTFNVVLDSSKITIYVDGVEQDSEFLP